MKTSVRRSSTTVPASERPPDISWPVWMVRWVLRRMGEMGRLPPLLL